jgi:hypothetical protein
MITCSACGKPIDKLPLWLSRVEAQFICNNCPNRQTKNIAFLTLDTPQAVKIDEEEPEVEEVEADEEE